VKNLYGRVPVVLDFGDPLYLDNPYPVLPALRSSAAVSKGVRAPPYGSASVATRYAEVLIVLKDSRFSVEPRNLSGGNRMERWWMPRSFRLVTEGLLNKDDPDHYRLRNPVEELLRYTNPVQFGASRIALEDMKLGEVMIKKHDVVIAMLSSGNRDETIFQDPERLNISRNPRAARTDGGPYRL
jgi:cytochrome P450